MSDALDQLLDLLDLEQIEVNIFRGRSPDERVQRITGTTSPIVFEGLPEDDPKVRQPDITRAREILGWEPKVSLDEGLRRTLDSLGVTPVAV